MFTGLIREIGTLRAITSVGGVVRVGIDAPVTAGSVQVGDSVAVDGICLTVSRCTGRMFTVEAVGETRRVTTLGRWRPGRRVHLEPALRVGDPLDGHLMQGHVDGLGVVRRLRKSGGGLAVTIDSQPAQRRFLTPKGSVGVDGVSLTVDEGPFSTGFTVSLIPHTLAATHFAGLRRGTRVNLEMDVLVKAVRSGNLAELPTVKHESGGGETARSGLTMEQLLARGFGRSRPRK